MRRPDAPFRRDATPGTRRGRPVDASTGRPRPSFVWLRRLGRRQRAGLGVAQDQAGGRVEEVQTRGVHGELDGVADGDRLATVDAGGEHRPLVVGEQRAVVVAVRVSGGLRVLRDDTRGVDAEDDVALGAELLDDVRLDRMRGIQAFASSTKSKSDGRMPRMTSRSIPIIGDPLPSAIVCSPKVIWSR
jgi:hypothetical protein